MDGGWWAGAELLVQNCWRNVMGWKAGRLDLPPYVWWQWFLQRLVFGTYDDTVRYAGRHVPVQYRGLQL
jgi:hypothetical protein